MSGATPADAGTAVPFNAGGPDIAANTLTPERIAEVRRVFAETGSVAETSRRTGLSDESVRKYCKGADGVRPYGRKADHEPPSGTPRLPDPAPEAGGPRLPDAVAEKYEPFRIDGAGQWGILNDCHIPYHDRRTIELFRDECKRRNVSGILFNGDVLDFYHLSHHYRLPDKPRTRMEIEAGRQFFAWFRSQFPNARLVFKLGNHDERLKKYLVEKAEELYDLEELQLEALLHLADYGVETVSDQRVVMLGKLPAVHGHEFRGQGGVMPARWLYLRTGDTAICGHFHRPSHYQFRTIRDHHVGCWSVGCACYLKPAWLRLNQWEHGFAFADISHGGNFRIDNLRVLKDGSVV